LQKPHKLQISMFSTVWSADFFQVHASIGSNARL